LGNDDGWFFRAAPYHKLQDPLQRCAGTSIFAGKFCKVNAYYTACSERWFKNYATHPDIRAACDKGMSSHIAELTRDVEAAKNSTHEAQWTLKAWAISFRRSAGRFIFAKRSKTQMSFARACASEAYLEALFNQPRQISRKEK